MENLEHRQHHHHYPLFPPPTVPTEQQQHPWDLASSQVVLPATGGTQLVQSQVILANSQHVSCGQWYYGISRSPDSTRRSLWVRKTSINTCSKPPSQPHQKVTGGPCQVLQAGRWCRGKWFPRDPDSTRRSQGLSM